jgi:hypothetical protein
MEQASHPDSERRDSVVHIAPDDEWTSDFEATMIVGLSGYCERHGIMTETSPRFVTCAEALDWARSRAANVVIRVNDDGPWGRIHYWAGDGDPPDDETPLLDLEAAEAELARELGTLHPVPKQPEVPNH